MKKIFLLITATLAASGLWILSACTENGTCIDREAVVSRHSITITQTVPHSPTQVGNGHFAFGADITGLQTFTPFSTMSDWGWHSYPVPEGVDPDKYEPVPLTTHGRTIPYWLPNDTQPEICEYLKLNPHRVNLGRLRFILSYPDGTAAVSENEISDAVQTVDLWTGLVTSSFRFDGTPVDVKLSCHPQRDIVAVEVTSKLVSEGRLSVGIDFPYAEHIESDDPKYVGDFSNVTAHTTDISAISEGYRIVHTMDDLTYAAVLHFENSLPEAVHDCGHSYSFHPKGMENSMSFTCEFDKECSEEACHPVPAAKVENAYSQMWKDYWESGAAVDFSRCTDPRAAELERRVVLSQYVMRINEAGTLPPQESGLVNNGWYGRYHFEMMWWHGAHFGLWNRFSCLGYLNIYQKFLSSACERAASEGRKGARWPKCTANINREWPCDAHALLVWQQPHPIWFAEMEYRADPSDEVLAKWRDVIIATADYMADVVFLDIQRGEYVLGPPMVLVSENTDYMKSTNPSFELSYFRYGLRTALVWADRLGLGDEVTAKWKEVLTHLAPLPVEDGVYVTYEGIENMWSAYNFEHPALTGVYGWLPGDGVDPETFKETFHKVTDTWRMDRIWGWDYTMLAMAAARLGESDTAVNLLTSTTENMGFDVHGFSESWPFPYFPTTGGLLSAVAMMCGGWDGSQGDAPGFPKDSKWDVRYEGFQRMQ